MQLCLKYFLVKPTTALQNTMTHHARVQNASATQETHLTLWWDLNKFDHTCNYIIITFMVTFTILATMGQECLLFELNKYMNTQSYYLVHIILITKGE